MTLKINLEDLAISYMTENTFTEISKRERKIATSCSLYRLYDLPIIFTYLFLLKPFLEKHPLHWANLNLHTHTHTHTHTFTQANNICLSMGYLLMNTHDNYETNWHKLLGFQFLNLFLLTAVLETQQTLCLNYSDLCKHDKPIIAQNLSFLRGEGMQAAGIKPCKAG